MLFCLNNFHTTDDGIENSGAESILRALQSNTSLTSAISGVLFCSNTFHQIILLTRLWFLGRLVSRICFRILTNGESYSQNVISSCHAQSAKLHAKFMLSKLSSLSWSLFAKSSCLTEGAMLSFLLQVRLMEVSHLFTCLQNSSCSISS